MLTLVSTPLKEGEESAQRVESYAGRIAVELQATALEPGLVSGPPVWASGWIGDCVGNRVRKTVVGCWRVTGGKKRREGVLTEC